MNNILLGKTLKAMYKQSGKTVTQLSDCTGLSIDTLNNLFYARVQKPGLSDVDSLTRAMGFSLAQLMDFMSRDYPENADITAEFAKYTMACADAVQSPQDSQPSAAEAAENSESPEIRALKAEHEKQLDRFRATHLLYVEQIQNQYRAQLSDMEKLLTNDRALNISRATNRILGIALFIETACLVILAFCHMQA